MLKKIFLGGASCLLPFLLCGQVPYQAGWPVEVDGYMTSPISIADVDDDGEKDIVVSDSQPGASPIIAKLYIYRLDGTLKSGWPVVAISSYNPPALADLDDDGTLEIISIYAGLHVYKNDGTLLWEHLYSGPIFQGTSAPSQVSIEDIDNDGMLEIVVTCGTGEAVFVFEPDGSVRPGWPVVSDDTNISASIGDIDLDGLKEIVFGNRKIWCLKPDGSICSGFPFDLPSTYHSHMSKPVLADIDGDGFLEIIFGADDSNIRILTFNGTLYPGYPIAQGARGISVGDINFDNSLDVIIPWGLLYGYDPLTQTLLPNFPFSDPSGIWAFVDKAPILGGLSNDQGEEIAAGAINGGWVSDGKLFAFNLQGQVLPGFPSNLLFHRALTTGCTVNDLDDDGDIELCCGSNNAESSVPKTSTVYCWDVPHPYNLDNIDWAMDGFDLQHTGRWRKLYHINKISSTLTVEDCTASPCTLPADGKTRVVTVTATREADGTHPAGQDVRYSRTLGCGDYSGPVIDNGDGTYTRMLQAPTIGCTTDLHAWVNEFKLADSATINFVDCLSNLGDVNLNGQISALDASLILQAVVGLISLDPVQQCLADVNENGLVSSLDAAYVLMCTVGNCPGLPAGFLPSCTAHDNCL